MLMLLACLAGCGHAGVPVKTMQGSVVGVDEDGLTVYKGIPFATPPVGSLRWRPPQPPAAWSGVLRADTFRPRCVQAHEATPFALADAPQSEDCLYLNIWSPAKRAGERLPVMVWLYGGSFQSGAGSDPFWFGDDLARKGVVVVTLNYRLGTLGFLALRELSQESGHSASGNYGLMDIIAALQWVKANIVSVGGDPRNVTVFGWSAGSWAISQLMASPMAHGLFERAIGESSGSFKPTNYPSDVPAELKSAEEYGAALEKKLGAHSLSELRAMPADRLFAAGQAWPIVDGYVLPQDTYSVFAAGKQNDVPILVGSNSEDGVNTRPMSAAQFTESVRKRVPGLADRVLAIYPARTDAEAARSQIRLATDTTFGWEAWTWARLQSKTGSGRAFLYYFNHRAPYPNEEPFKEWWGVPHAGELFYVFGHFVPGWKWTKTDESVRETVSSYWVNFARTGDPNGEGLPRWEAFTEERQGVMHVDDSFAMGAVANREGLGVVDEYVGMLRGEMQ